MFSFFISARKMEAAIENLEMMEVEEGGKGATVVPCSKKKTMR